MTLEEFKGKVYHQNEVARIKKLDGYTMIDVEFEDDEDFLMMDLKDIDKKLYQINVIRGVESQVDGNKVLFFTEGKAHIFYYKYPVQIDEETDDDYVFELDKECLDYAKKQ